MSFFIRWRTEQTHEFLKNTKKNEALAHGASASAEKLDSNSQSLRFTSLPLQIRQVFANICVKNIVLLFCCFFLKNLFVGLVSRKRARELALKPTWVKV